MHVRALCMYVMYVGYARVYVICVCYALKLCLYVSCMYVRYARMLCVYAISVCCVCLYVCVVCMCVM